MTKDFYKKHQDVIKTTLGGGRVKYVSSSGNGTNTVVHCYYIDGKGARISAYAMKNKRTNIVSKYILKVMVMSDTKNQKSVSSARDTDKYAKRIFNMLSAKYTEQIAHTQLQHEWKNPAFVHKR